MHSHKRERVEEASAGDIVAASGLKDVLTGDTLCDPAHRILLKGLSIPEPVVSLAVEPKGAEDRENCRWHWKSFSGKILLSVSGMTKKRGRPS